MAVENFTEMRDKVADPRFQLERKVEKLLEARFPSQYISRYAMVTFLRVPYRVALVAGMIENEILSELCAGLNSPEEVDMEKARELIELKLSPYLRAFAPA